MGRLVFWITCVRTWFGFGQNIYSHTGAYFFVTELMCLPQIMDTLTSLNKAY